MPDTLPPLAPVSPPIIDDFFDVTSPYFNSALKLATPPSAQNSFTEAVSPIALAAGAIQGGAANGLSWDGVTMSLAGRIFAINSQIATTFEASGRFSPGIGGTGTATFGTEGLDLETGTTNPSFAFASWQAIFTNLFKGSPVFSATCEIRILGTGGQFFAGIGNMNTAANVFTTAHIGFKIVSGILYATQADGVTESSIPLVTVTSGDVINIVCRVNGTKSVDYYFRKYFDSFTGLYNEVFSTAMSLSANIPSTISPRIVLSANNGGTANNFRALIAGATYSI